jgi:hypothetical protein
MVVSMCSQRKVVDRQRVQIRLFLLAITATANALGATQGVTSPSAAIEIPLQPQANTRPSQNPEAVVAATAKEQERLPQLSTDEIYALHRLKLQQELQSELLNWAQNRFWLVALLTLLIGFFGVRALVREMLATELKDATRASADAQAAAGQGRDAVREMKAEARKHTDEVSEVSKAAGDLRKQLSEVKSRLDAESVRLDAGLTLKVSALEQQIAELTSSLTNIAALSPGSAPAANSAVDRIAEIRARAATQDESFSENSKYRIVVVHHVGSKSRTEPIAKQLVDRLSKRGFKASIATWSSGQKDGKEPVSLQYRTHASEVAGVVEGVIEQILSDFKQQTGVVRESENWTEDYDLRIFF